MNTQTETNELKQLRETAKQYALLIQAYEKTLQHAKRLHSGVITQEDLVAGRIVDLFDQTLLQHRTAKILKGINQ